jgi:hypothetical protein
VGALNVYTEVKCAVSKGPRRASLLPTKPVCFRVLGRPLSVAWTIGYEKIDC